LEEAGFSSDIGEGAVAIVTVKDILAVVTDEEIVPAVVVVVADAAALAPSAVSKACFGRDIGEGAIPVIFEEVRNGFLSLGKAFEARAVDEEDVDPVVVVVVEESYPTACGFEQISVLVFAAVDGFGVEAGLAGYIDEIDTKRCARNRRWQTFGRRPRLRIVDRAGAEL
jgi:hypothetical protein